MRSGHAPPPAHHVGGPPGNGHDLLGVCVCVCARARARVFVCVYVCVCACVCTHDCVYARASVLVCA